MLGCAQRPFELDVEGRWYTGYQWQYTMENQPARTPRRLHHDIDNVRGQWYVINTVDATFAQRVNETSPVSYTDHS